MVVVLFDNQPIAQQAGEFSAVFQNGSRDLESRLENWKAASFTGDERM